MAAATNSHQHQQDPTLLYHLGIVDLKSILKEQKDLFEKIDLNKSYLPRNWDVLSYYYYCKYNKTNKFNDKLVIQQIENIWKKTEVQIFTYTSIRTKLQRLIKAYESIKFDIRTHSYITEKITETLRDFNSIFFVGKCKCFIKKSTSSSSSSLLPGPDGTSQLQTVPSKCTCDHKLGDNQFKFLIDQLSDRKLMIAEYLQIRHSSEMNTNNNVDVHPDVSSIITNLKNITITPAPIASVNNNAAFSSSPPSESSSEADDSPEYKPHHYLFKALNSSKSKFCSVRDLDFDQFCYQVIRKQTSVRQAATLVNSALEMVGAISEENKSLVVTPSLVQRKTQKAGSKLVSEEAALNIGRPITAFFFDGFQAINRTKIKVNNEFIVNHSTKYENIVLVEQPFDRYLGFFELLSATADDVHEGLKNFFVSRNMDLSPLIAIGSDGAATNLGELNGAIVQFERYINRPLHRTVCMLHLLELMLHAVIELYYGSTIGPKKYKNEIHTQLLTCEHKQIVAFDPIKLGILPFIAENANVIINSTHFNSDQKLLFRLAEAVDTGNIDDKLAVSNLGNLSEIRWTVYAKRFNRLYMSTPNPPMKLIQVVKFIQNVYMPMLCWIKCFPEWVNGTPHLYRMFD